MFWRATGDVLHRLNCPKSKSDTGNDRVFFFKSRAKDKSILSLGGRSSPGGSARPSELLLDGGEKGGSGEEAAQDAVALLQALELPVSSSGV